MLQNVVAGISGGMIACFGDPSPKRQERLLYVAMSILAVNTVNAVITEWTFYWTGELLPDEDVKSHVKALVANGNLILLNLSRVSYNETCIVSRRFDYIRERERERYRVCS